MSVAAVEPGPDGLTDVVSLHVKVYGKWTKVSYTCFKKMLLANAEVYIRFSAKDSLIVSSHPCQANGALLLTQKELKGGGQRTDASPKC